MSLPHELPRIDGGSPLLAALMVTQLRAASRLDMTMQRDAAQRQGIVLQVTDREGIRGAAEYLRRYVRKLDPNSPDRDPQDSCRTPWEHANGCACPDYPLLPRWRWLDEPDWYERIEAAARANPWVPWEWSND